VQGIIDNRKGSMLSTKSTTRRALRQVGLYDETWGSKRNRGGVIMALYDVVLDEFEKKGGVYFDNTRDAGDHYQFPLKERKT